MNLKNNNVSLLMMTIICSVIILWSGISATPPTQFSIDEKIRFYLRSDLFLDDAFYYFKTAENLALHGIVSFDLINTTNGFHPLWFLLMLPIAGSFEPVELLMTVVWLELLLYFSSALIIARALKLHGLKGVILFLVMIALFSYYHALRNTLNGLETSLHIFLISASVLATKKYHEGKKYNYLYIIFPLLFLSRIESILFITVFLIVFLFYEKTISNRAIKLIGIVTLTFLSYTLINFLYVGELLPVSGAAKRAYANFAFGHSLSLSSWAEMALWPIDKPWLLTAFIINAISIPVYVYNKEKTGLILSIYCIIKFFIYLILYKGSAGFYSWYYAPDFMASIYFVGWFLNKIEVKKIDKLFFYGIGTLATLFIIIQISYFQHSMYKLNKLISTNKFPQVGSDLDLFYLAAKIINDKDLPKNTILGMHNSGVFGFFSKYRVINMDGLINGSVRLEYIKRYGYNWIPYIDEYQKIDGYLDLIPKGNSDIYMRQLQSRNFSFYPLQINIDQIFGARVIQNNRSEMMLFYKYPQLLNQP